MGQRILTFCDPDKDTDEHAGTPYRLRLERWDGTRWVEEVRSSVVDLCAEQRAALLDAPVEAWEKWQRPAVDAPANAPTGASSARGPFPCTKDPDCPYGPFSHRSTRRKHERQHHGKPAVEPVEPAPQRGAEVATARRERTGKRVAAATDYDTRTVRAWAAGAGVECPSQGRFLPRSVVEAWRQATRAGAA